MSLQVDSVLSQKRESSVYGTRIKIGVYLDYEDEVGTWQKLNRVFVSA